MQFKNSFSVMRKQFGLTLIEALSFLAIFGVVAVGAVSMFGSTSDSAKVNLIATEVHAIKAAVKSRALAGTAYTNINMATLNTGGALSTNITSVTGAGATSKGTMADGTGFVVTGAATSFSVVVSGLTNENCASLLLSLANSGTTTTPSCTSGSATFTYR